MADLGEIRLKLTADSDQFVKGTSFARDALVEMSDEIAGAVVDVMKFGAELAKTAVELSGDFESSLVSAGSKANATAAELERMREAAMQAGLDSAFGAKEAADGLGDLAQAGFDVEEQIAALADTLNLASAGKIDVSESASIAANALNAFRMEAGEAGRVADVLVKAANNADTSVSDLGKALGNAGGIAGQMGQDLEGIVAILGQMQNVGISAAEAGTAVRSSLAKLSDPTGKAAKALADLGVNSRDADGELRQLTDILVDMERQGASAQDFVAAFGEEVGPKLATALASGADGLKTFESALLDAGGEAQRVANEKLDTLNGALDILKGSFETLAIEFGSKLAPAIKAVATELTAMTNELMTSEKESGKFSKRVSEMIDNLVKFLKEVGPLVEIVAAFGGLLIEMSKALRIAGLGLEYMGNGAAAAFALLKGNVTQARIIDAEMHKIAAQAVEIGKTFGDGFSSASEAAASFNEMLGRVSKALARVNDEKPEANNPDDYEFFGPDPFWQGPMLDSGSDKKKEEARATDKLTNSTSRLTRKTQELNRVRSAAQDQANSVIAGIKKAAENMLRVDSDLDELLGGLGPKAGEFKEAEEYVESVRQAAEQAEQARSAMQVDIENERREFTNYIKQGLLDFAHAIAQSLGEGASELAGLASNIGQGAAAGAQFGPKGAAVGAALGGATGLLGIASKTENFGIGLERVGEKIDELGVPFDSLGEAVNEAIRIFWPIAEIFLTMGEVLKPVIAAIKEVDFTTVAKVLFEAIKVFGLVWLNIADVLTEITTFIWKVIAGVVRFIADLISKVNDFADFLVPDAVVSAFNKMANAAEKVRDTSEALNNGIEDAKDNLKGLSFETSKLNDAQSSLNEEIRAGLTNVPEIFRLNLRRAQSDGGRSPFADMDIGPERLGGSSQTSIFEGDIFVIANNPEEFEKAMGRKQFVQTGASDVQPALTSFQLGGF